jgi:hypothetical protein
MNIFKKDDNNLKKILSYSYSNYDIQHYLGEDAKILEYQELKQYSNLFELLPNDKSYAVILIEVKQNVGHWICICRSGNGATNGIIYYMDPYGKGVDEELKLISPWWRRKLNETEKLLLKLVNDCPYEIEYNGLDVESHKSYVSTCGRWCCWFIMYFLKGHTLEQFQYMLNYMVESKNYEKYKDLKYDLLVIQEINYQPS